MVEVRRFADLAAAKAAASLEVDRAAEVTCARCMVAGVGHAEEYREALEEARDFLASVNGPDYPLLQADVDAGVAATYGGVALEILSEHSTRTATFAAVRHKRRLAYRLISEAVTQAAVAQQRRAACVELAQVGVSQIREGACAVVCGAAVTVGGERYGAVIAAGAGAVSAKATAEVDGGQFFLPPGPITPVVSGVARVEAFGLAGP